MKIQNKDRLFELFNKVNKTNVKILNEEVSFDYRDYRDIANYFGETHANELKHHFFAYITENYSREEIRPELVEKKFDEFLDWYSDHIRSIIITEYQQGKIDFDNYRFEDEY